MTVNPSAIVKPFGRKAHDFVMTSPEADKRYNFLIGAVRSSKTFALDAKTIVQLSRYNVAGKRFMTGATKQTLYRNVLIDLFEIAGKQNYSYNGASGELWLFGKQWFCMGAKDEGSYKQILGSTVGICVSDEVVEYPKSFLAQMFMRMSPEGARFYGSTNPGNPYCYLKSEVLDNKEFAPRMNVLNFRLDDNPNISAESRAAIESSQVGVFRLRYIDGLWVVAEGSIYRDSWSDRENVFANTARLSDDGRFKYDKIPIGLKGTGGHVDRWYAVDAGVDHPQVHGEFYDDGDVIWLTRTQRWDSRKEMRQKTDKEYSDDLKAFGALDYQVIVPPEAASLKAQLIQDGFWVTDADNSVVEGIHTVSTLLSRRKLRINVDECHGIEKRIPVYAWDAKAAKRGEEAPLKIDDDDCDMLRYGVHGKVPAWRWAAQ